MTKENRTRDGSKPTAEKKGKGRGKRAVPANKEPSQTPESCLPPPKKKKSKVMNQRERNEMLASLESVDLSVLLSEVYVKFDEQLFSEKLKKITVKLHDTEQPLKDIIVSHRLCFVGLYKECKKGPESFLRFQFQWQKYCSAFLLASQHTMLEIGLPDPVGYQIDESRTMWLRFCEENDVPVPVSNPVMMTISSALYHCLLGHVNHFQSNNSSTTSSSNKSTTQVADGDDVYFRFGGAAISDLLHLHYKEMKHCKDDQRNILSQEISILHCMNSKDKVSMPSYLKYRDQGYMYSPDPTFIPFLRQVDTAVKETVNPDWLHQEGDNLIKITHERIQEETKFFDTFKEILASKSPNITIYSEDAIRNVFETFTRKICNTRIQEFLSATKQQLATKKGLASTVDINLRPTLLAHHAKLETKLGSKK
ncbi:uncharacterized protein [Dysidea avara]